MSPGGPLPVDESEPVPDRGAALSELIEVERRIWVEISAAEAEAEHLVEAAREFARAARRDEDGSVAEGVYALRGTIEDACLAAIREVETQADAEVDRYASVDEPTLERLAHFVVARITGEMGER